MRSHYALALGSNRRTRHGSPAATLRAAMTAFHTEGLTVIAASPILATPALGPAGRSFANAAAVIETDLAPPALLARLKRIERRFGRRAGRRWGARALDLDILLWSEGSWPPHPRSPRADRLAIPHRALAERSFVLMPLARIAPRWRVPLTNLTIAQLRARFIASRPAPRALRRPGI